MAEEPEVIPQTFMEKLLFYTTAFFVLLGTFSLFAFLFLVPFVIDPAFTTIFMQFDPVPALCETMDTETRNGASNCSWSSCREGCTKEVYECTQIRVNYKLGYTEDLEMGEEASSTLSSVDSTVSTKTNPSTRLVGRNASATTVAARFQRAIREYDYHEEASGTLSSEGPTVSTKTNPSTRLVGGNESAPTVATRFERAIREYDYLEGLGEEEDEVLLEAPMATGLMGNDSEWYYMGAKLFPNVKGCGYPPMLNCSIFLKQYRQEGKNFSCYYSKVDPGLVITTLDMHQVYMNLVYAMAIPIPSFIISVIYLTFAYFVIYHEEEEEAALVGEEGEEGDAADDGMTPVPNLTSGAITPGSEVFREDLASFGHQLKVAMADEMSRESVADAVPNSTSIPGNLTRTMTTSISTPAGPIAAV